MIERFVPPARPNRLARLFAVRPRGARAFAMRVAASSWLGGLLAASAWSHPMGNFTVNHYSRITVQPAGLRVHFVLDMAELPTLAERQVMDRNEDREVSSAEARSYIRARAPRWLAGLKATVDGSAVAWSLKRANLVFTPGVANLYVMRIELDLAAALSPGRHRITYEDTTYAERRGWKELVVGTAGGIGRPAGNVPTREISRELRSYPADLLSAPPQIASVRFEVTIPRTASRTMPPRGAKPVGRL